MAEPVRPALYTIPAHRSFADSLAAGLLALHGRRDMPQAIARGVVLLPNNRAVRAVRDAFIRASGEGLLLPRLVAIGDADLSERVGVALDAIGVEEDVPPAIAPMDRLMILARLVQQARRGEGHEMDAAEALRLGAALGSTLDQLQVERRTARDLAELDVGDALSSHWQQALSTFRLMLDAWPQELARRGCIDAAERRNRIFDATARHWRMAPPPGYVVAAGITTSAPAVAALLRTVATLPGGMVVFPDLDQNLDADQWTAIGPPPPSGDGLPPGRGVESHPQFALKLLLDRMGYHRDEVALWRWGSSHDARAARGRAISLAMLPAHLTGLWSEVQDEARSLGEVRAIEAATPAEEAQAIAIALREAMETPGRTAALVTPDRDLATRVSAHLRRWGIMADDSAGRPLSQLPAGTLLMAVAEAAASRFAPVPLLALLKHPLVAAGEGRLAWLDRARTLDLMLRGPRPAPGLEGVDALFAEPGRHKALALELADWWQEVKRLLTPLAEGFAAENSIAALTSAVRVAAGALSGDAVWTGYQGRAAAELIADLEAAGPEGPERCSADAYPALLGELLAAQAVRPPQGGHPRIAIWGLIEARLQQTDLMILAGLNEGVWPALPAPDPWLAPRVRHALGLPGLERRIGLAGHDFANGLGAPQVLITRAMRDASAPTVASRFWLRLKALAGPKWREDERLLALARAIDRPAAPTRPVAVPAPCPPAGVRPREIAVTDVDRLKADPYGFYARRILRLSQLDPVDADPSAAWRGTAVHDVLEQWHKLDNGRPDLLVPRARAMLARAHAHPVMRVLWQPRLMSALEWIAASVARLEEEGRTVALCEQWGKAEIAGVILRGKADRIDRIAADGSIVVVDYKTGKAPSTAQVVAGYALQLGLIALIARDGRFDTLAPGAIAAGFEYWSLGSDGKGGFGRVTTPCDPKGARGRIVTDSFVDLVGGQFRELAETYLVGTSPFPARPHPDAPVFTDYDQLMRLDEWFGRGDAAGGADG